MTVNCAELTQNQRGPVGDSSFEALVEDLVQKHDGLTTEREAWSQIPLNANIEGK